MNLMTCGWALLESQDEPASERMASAEKALSLDGADDDYCADTVSSAQSLQSRSLLMASSDTLDLSISSALPSSNIAINSCLSLTCPQSTSIDTNIDVSSAIFPLLASSSSSSLCSGPLSSPCLDRIVFDHSYIEGEAWEKNELLGTGAFSSVYRSTDRGTGTVFAVKQLCLCANTRATEKCIAMAVSRELALIQRLPRHPHTISYYGSVSEDNHVNIFMELVEGESLSALLERKGALALDVLRKYGRQVLLGLEHLHNHGIIHRDIKGGNILWSRCNDMVKLCDFGAAVLLQGNQTQHGEFVSSHGTPAFMAPEVIRGESYGRRADIWSFACTLIEMASGQPPWSELGVMNPFALMYRVASTSDIPEHPRTLASSVGDILQRCFARDQLQRPLVQELLCHRFFCGS